MKIIDLVITERRNRKRYLHVVEKTILSAPSWKLTEKERGRLEFEKVKTIGCIKGLDMAIDILNEHANDEFLFRDLK